MLVAATGASVAKAEISDGRPVPGLVSAAFLGAASVGLYLAYGRAQRAAGRPKALRASLRALTAVALLAAAVSAAAAVTLR